MRNHLAMKEQRDLLARQKKELAEMLVEKELDNEQLREAENLLNEAEWKFRALFENGPIGVAYHRMIYDDSGKAVDYFFLDANDRYLELTGVDPRGKTVLQAFPGIKNDPFDWIGTFGKVSRTGEAIRFDQYLQPNNRWYHIVGYQYKPDHFVAAFCEITELRQAEESLLASERRFKALIRNSSDSITILDKDGIQIYVSDVVEKMLGYKPSELINIPVIDEMIHPDDQMATRAAFMKLLQGEEVATQYRHKHKNGSWVFLEAWGTNQLENPDIRGVVVNVRDITDRKKAEAEKANFEYRLHQVQKMEAIGQLAGGVAHDFNNKLMAILKLRPQLPCIYASGFSTEHVQLSEEEHFIQKPYDFIKLSGYLKRVINGSEEQ